jgi:CHAD domain-containing protein
MPVPAIILHFMKRPAELLFSLDRTWNNFSTAWKKARSKSSEKSVHDLRVTTRRLLATLELANGLARHPGVPKLQRRLKKILKRMGPLRDVQVQLQTLQQVGQGDLIADFKQTLKRREKREIDGIPQELKRGRKQRLEGELKQARSQFSRLHESKTQDRIHRAVERILSSRRNEFLRAEKRFQRVQQRDEEALHEMRIALKKLRYAVEAAEPVLGPSAREQSRDMRTFQQLMGESRDLEMLRGELEKWAKKKGKRIAVAPSLDRLQEKREALVKKIVESSSEFGKVLQTANPKPVSEKTHAVAAPAQTPIPVVPRSS